MILFDIMKAVERNGKLLADLKLQIEDLEKKIETKELEDKYRDYKTSDGLFRRKR